MSTITASHLRRLAATILIGGVILLPAFVAALRLTVEHPSLP